MSIISADGGDGQRHGPRRSRKCTAPDTQKPRDSLLSPDMTLTAHQDEQGWRTRFQRRFLKQQQWQAERQRHKKGKETEESSFNIPSATSHGLEKGGAHLMLDPVSECWIDLGPIRPLR